MEPYAPKAVFLSYASEDAEAAARIAAGLEAAGIEVWFDRAELRGGDEWDAKIRRQVKSCALFVPVISARTQQRTEGYFRREWNLATHRLLDMAPGKPFLMPVVIDDTKEDVALVAEEFQRVHWTRLPGGSCSPQFIAQVKRLLGAPVEPAPPVRLAGAASPVNAAPSASRRVPVAVGVAALVLVVAGGLTWWRLAAPAPVPGSSAEAAPPAGGKPGGNGSPSKELRAPALNPLRIAVLPLDNFSPDASDAYLAGGMTEELTSGLSKISGLEVISRTSADRVKMAKKSLAEIGAELRAGTLLEGSVRKAGNLLRISVQLIEVATQRHLWAHDFDREFKDIFKVQSDVATRVTEVLKVTLLGSEVQRMKKQATSNLEAFRLYSQGRYLWNKRTGPDHAKAIDYFNQALALDPRYAEAQLGLALIFATNYIRRPNKEAMAKAQAAATKALELDPSLGEAHAVLGMAKNYLYDWIGAEKELRLSIQLSPNSATAHQWYGEHLGFRRRFDEALAENLRAQELDPLSPIIKSVGAWALVCTGQTDEAIQKAQEGLELHPGFAHLHLILGSVYLAKGLYAEAAAEFKKGRALDPSHPFGISGLAYALARAGDREHALQALKELEELVKKGFGVQTEIAFVYQGLGETEKVLESLERAVEAGVFMAHINLGPFFDELRPNRRFQAILRKIGLGE